MVMEGLDTILLGLIALCATGAAIIGLVVLSGFFHNKLQDLFSDSKYFIFFFLVAGYFSYALGEISFYLSSVVFGSDSPIGVQDVYWSIGAIMILISFIALVRSLYRENHDSKIAFAHLIFAALIVGVTLFIVFVFGGWDSEYFFSTFYPVISSLIVACSFAMVFFYNRSGPFGKVLLMFFFSSCSILLGDIFFHFAKQQAIYGTSGMMADIFYLIGYALSALTFITMRLRMHSAARANPVSAKLRKNASG